MARLRLPWLPISITALALTRESSGPQTAGDEVAMPGHRPGVLDLDDVGTPVGEHGAGAWHVRPRGQFDDFDSAEQTGHVDSFRGLPKRL